MKLLILALMVLSLSAFAADKKVAQSSTPKTGAQAKTLDVAPKEAKEEITDETATLTDKHPMKAHVTCITKDGHELKQGDTGYDACIAKVKANKNSKNDPKAAVEVKFEK